MKTIVAFGETLWDLLPEGPVLGGAPCNFAYRLHELGERAVLVTRLGRDDLGKKAFERLQALGMDLGFVQWDDRHPTGTVPVTVDAKGVPDFTITPGVAYDHIESTAALLELAKSADAIAFGTLVQRSPASRATLRRLLEAAPRALRFLDLNLRKGCHSPETVTASLERAGLLKLNDGEALHLRRAFGLRGRSPEAVAREVRRRWSLKACVVTRGERGAFVATRGGEAEVPGLKVEVVDTIGSGDAFSAAFLTGWLAGRPAAACLREGNALGAMVARQKGATEPIRPEAFRDFMSASVV